MNDSLRLNLQLHVPIKELKAFIKVEKIDEKVSLSQNKIGLIEEIDKILASKPESKDYVERLVKRYKGAGRCSVSWAMSDKPKIPQEIEKTLKDKYGDSVIKSELRPEITNKPSLNKAEWIDEENTILRLEFVEAGKERIEYVGYEIKKYYPTKFVDCFIHLGDKSLVTEVRGDLAMAEKYHKKIAYILDFDTELIKFSRVEIAEIEKTLKTDRKSATHKRLGGDLDTISVRASLQTKDLKTSSEYNKMCGNDEVHSATCKYEYRDNSGEVIIVTIDINQHGSVWFRSEVPEEIINHAFSVVKSVKSVF